MTIIIIIIIQKYVKLTHEMKPRRHKEQVTAMPINLSPAGVRKYSKWSKKTDRTWTQIVTAKIRHAINRWFHFKSAYLLAKWPATSTPCTHCCCCHLADVNASNIHTLSDSRFTKITPQDIPQHTEQRTLFDGSHKYHKTCFFPNVFKAIFSQAYLLCDGYAKTFRTCVSVTPDSTSPHSQFYCNATC